MQRKVTLIGGGGVRTPLLIHGILQSQPNLAITELQLYDLDHDRAQLMAKLGREIAENLGVQIHIQASENLEPAVEGAAFVLSSLRVGGMAARARDERLSIEQGLAGQETTGPGGVAMALRTIPVALSHARVIERLAPKAWLINFTNPAGLITQALQDHSNLKTVGICDTPAELFHKIAAAIGSSPTDTFCDYAGLNHLGWVKSVFVQGKDVTNTLLEDQVALQKLYHASLFDPALIQTLRLIPSEYLFFYYSQRKAYRNQLKAGASRGEELVQMNLDLFGKLRSQSASEGLRTYRHYLMQRNASYMKIEGEAGSAFRPVENEPDPFETATGYHRIAVEVMLGLVSETPRTVVVNVRNRGSIEDLGADDVVEVPCKINNAGVEPQKTGSLPDSVRGLVQAVKAYEYTAIRAAIAGSWSVAQLAMLEYPVIGQWEIAQDVRRALSNSDPEHLGYLK